MCFSISDELLFHVTSYILNISLTFLSAQQQKACSVLDMSQIQWSVHFCNIVLEDTLEVVQSLIALVTFF